MTQMKLASTAVQAHLIRGPRQHSNDRSQIGDVHFGATSMSTEYRAGPLDQAAMEARPDALVCSSEVLAHIPRSPGGSAQPAR